jgi:hypothetical protein
MPMTLVFSTLLTYTLSVFVSGAISMMPKLPGLVVVAMMLTGCQQIPVQDEASEFSRIVPGSYIVLHQNLTVPEGHARVFVQKGKVRAMGRLNQYYPHCDFEVRKVSDGTMQVLAGRFLVTHLAVGEERVVQRSQGFYRAALTMSGDYLPAMVAPYVHHQLHSDSQPQVMRLTCHSGFTELNDAVYPSVRDIRKALGSIASVEIKGKVSR